MEALSQSLSNHIPSHECHHLLVAASDGPRGGKMQQPKTKLHQIVVNVRTPRNAPEELLPDLLRSLIMAGLADAHATLNDGEGDLVSAMRATECAFYVNDLGTKLVPPEESSPTTVDEALRETILMWDWLSENPQMGKGDYLDLRRPAVAPIYECFACQYASEESGVTDLGPRVCMHCPIWPQEDGPTDEVMCAKESSPYGDWLRARGGTDRKARAAKGVADLARAALSSISQTTKGGSNE
jgi:hypothetical protein